MTRRQPATAFGLAVLAAGPNGAADAARPNMRSQAESVRRRADPFLVRWPAGLRPGMVNDTTVVSGADWLPTVCDLTGTPVPADVRQGLRGQSVAVALRGTRRRGGRSP
jgi:arylsulfatase A-like enzyme